MKLKKISLICLVSIMLTLNVSDEKGMPAVLYFQGRCV